MQSKNIERILITGAAGFIGHHLVDHFLTNTNFEIVCLDRLDFSGHLDRLNTVISFYDLATQKRVKIVYHDLKAAINSSVATAIGHIDYIYHLAASSHVDRSITDPLDFFQDNTIGTLNLLQFARGFNKLKMFLYFSTDEVYGPAAKNQFFTETDQCRPTNPYSASKAAAEQACYAYSNTYKLPIIITNVMNVIGRRQNPEKFIPKVIQLLLQNKTIPIHFNSKTGEIGSRFYVDVRDVCDAIFFLTKTIKEIKTTHCQKFNIVGQKEIANNFVVQTIAEYLGKKARIKKVDFEKDRPGHDMRYALSGAKMKLLGWEPKISFGNSIKFILTEKKAVR